MTTPGDFEVSLIAKHRRLLNINRPFGRILSICLGPLESRKQSFVAAWPYEPSYNDQVVVLLHNCFNITMNDAQIFIRRIACFLIPIRYDEQRPSPYKDTGLFMLTL